MANRTTAKILGAIDISADLFREYLDIIGIDLLYERHVKRKSPCRFRYIQWHGYGRNPGWWSPPEQWALNNAQIARHMKGSETYGVRAGAFKSLVKWVDFDIDNANFELNDERLDKIIRFFKPENEWTGERRILLQERESGNFSLLMRCCPMWPDQHQQVFREILSGIGLEVKPGVLEIYPSLERGRRLPFGDQQVLGVTSDGINGDWEIYPIYDKSEQIEAFRDLEPINAEKIRRDLRRGRELYPVSQPDRFESRVKFSAGSIHERSISDTLHNGLTEEGTRYEAEKRLIRYFYGLGHSEDLTYKLIKIWYENKTNGLSKDWNRNPSQVLRQLRNHIRTFYKWLRKHSASADEELEFPDAQLTTEDIRLIIEVCDWDIHFAEWVGDLLVWAKTRYKYVNRLYLSAKIMRNFRNGRDHRTKWLPKLKAKGILRCTNRFYEISRPELQSFEALADEADGQCRIYRLNWDFAEAGTVIPKDLSFRHGLVATVTDDEIIAHAGEHYSKRTAQRIIKKFRPEVLGLELEEVTPSFGVGHGRPPQNFAEPEPERDLMEEYEELFATGELIEIIIEEDGNIREVSKVEKAKRWVQKLIWGGDRGG